MDREDQLIRLAYVRKPEKGLGNTLKVRLGGLPSVYNFRTITVNLEEISVWQK